jgi:hypothetical protein
MIITKIFKIIVGKPQGAMILEIFIFKKTMTKIYLSGKLNDEKIDCVAVFKKYEKKYKSADTEIITPLILSKEAKKEIGKNLNEEELLTVKFCKISQCDKIVMLPHWENSIIAGVEFSFARFLQNEGSKIIIEEISQR